MGRALILLNSTEARQKAALWVNKAPWNTRITFQGPRRSTPQNDLMWSRLADISRQVVWHGQRYEDHEWKDNFMQALGRARWMPGIEGGMVPIGRRSSVLSKDEMKDLLDLMDAFAAEHGVVWSEPKVAAPKPELETA